MTALARLGYWSALATFATAAGYGVVQLLQLAGVLVFPWDEITIFGFSIGIPAPFVLAMVALHCSVPEDKRMFTASAVAFAVVYATLVAIVYPTQLAVVVPAHLAGELERVQFLAVAPHTFMWVIDGVGYISMGIATLLAAGAFAGDDTHKWLRRFLLANGLLDPVIVAIYIFPALLPVGALWLVTLPGSMLLLMRFFGGVTAPGAR